MACLCAAHLPGMCMIMPTISWTSAWALLRKEFLSSWLVAKVALLLSLIKNIKTSKLYHTISKLVSQCQFLPFRWILAAVLQPSRAKRAGTLSCLELFGIVWHIPCLRCLCLNDLECHGHFHRGCGSHIDPLYDITKSSTARWHQCGEPGKFYYVSYTCVILCRKIWLMSWLSCFRSFHVVSRFLGSIATQLSIILYDTQLPHGPNSQVKTVRQVLARNSAGTQTLLANTLRSSSATKTGSATKAYQSYIKLRLSMSQQPQAVLQPLWCRNYSQATGSYINIACAEEPWKCENHLKQCTCKIM